MTRLSYSSPIDPNEGIAAQIKALQQQVAELQRKLALAPTPVAWGSLGYATVTSNQGSITVETDITGLSVTVDVPAGRLIKVTASVAMVNSSAGSTTLVAIKEGATTLQARRVQHAVASLSAGVEVVAVLAPSAGSHTYKVSASPSAGTATSAGSSTQPALISVEDIGPA